MKLKSILRFLLGLIQDQSSEQNVLYIDAVFRKILETPPPFQPSATDIANMRNKLKKGMV